MQRKLEFVETECAVLTAFVRREVDASEIRLRDSAGKLGQKVDARLWRNSRPARACGLAPIKLVMYGTEKW